MEAMNEKYSVKNLLFYRAIPTYAVPENSAGHHLYSCKDCGDRFVLEDSYKYHIQRKSVQITYKCRHCPRRKIFYNRCNLLSHIRSHTFKTATINVSDLKIDPLPLNFFKTLNSDDSANTLNAEKSKQKANDICYLFNNCFECKKDITGIGPLYKDRASHYMEFTNEVHSCPICLFTLPTSCALRAHCRIHLRNPPYYCPECGVHLSNKSVIYPFNHGCEGFNMMRATTRRPCPIEQCTPFHPNDFRKHMKENHLKKIYKCPLCVVACYNELTMQRHLKTHPHKLEPLIFYQCEMCPGRLVMQSHADGHLRNHKPTNNYVFPCWICNTMFENVFALINHHIQSHDQNHELITCFKVLSNETAKKVYRVVKRCDQCNRNFTYKCRYEDINTLPNVCPYKCSPGAKSPSKKEESLNKGKIICPLCKDMIHESWLSVKQHYALRHKDHRCVEATISLPRINVKDYMKNVVKIKKKCVRGNIRKRPSKERKKITLKTSGDKKEKVLLVDTNVSGVELSTDKAEDLVEVHTINHKNKKKYCCRECGEFVQNKLAFSNHLLTHGIFDVDKYCCSTKKNKKIVNLRTSSCRN